MSWKGIAGKQSRAILQRSTNLALCYSKGRGTNRDDVKAVEWYKKSAEQGYSFAQNYLGYCYQHGLGAAKDFAAAVEWFKKSAAQRYAAAQYNLGNCYEEGIGVTKDEKKAMEYYQMAANQGNESAAGKIMEMKRKNGERSNRELWNSQGRCSYCGGQFNIFRYCKECGKKKDY